MSFSALQWETTDKDDVIGITFFFFLPDLFVVF